MGRTHDFFEHATIPGARLIPYTEAADRNDHLDDQQRVIVFSNGPQCGQSSSAIHVSLVAAFPAETIRYYRG
jgi:hypothetical protein